MQIRADLVGLASGDSVTLCTPCLEKARTFSRVTCFCYKLQMLVNDRTAMMLEMQESTSRVRHIQGLGREMGRNAERLVLGIGE